MDETAKTDGSLPQETSLNRSNLVESFSFNVRKVNNGYIVDHHTYPYAIYICTTPEEVLTQIKTLIEKQAA